MGTSPILMEFICMQAIAKGAFSIWNKFGSMLSGRRPAGCSQKGFQQLCCREIFFLI